MELHTIYFFPFFFPECSFRLSILLSIFSMGFLFCVCTYIINTFPLDHFDWPRWEAEYIRTTVFRQVCGVHDERPVAPAGI